MKNSFRSPAKIARRLKILPLAAKKIKNWPTFMYNYALGLVPKHGYRFRNGAQIKIGRGIDHVPIIEIFLKEDYGRMPDNAIIVDLGANIGTFTIYATSTAKNVKVYAYEPLKDFFNKMENNIRLNNQEQAVECFNLAVAGNIENRTLYVKGTDFFFPTLVSSEKEKKLETIQVKCTTISEIVESNDLKQIDILKMDCEGAEYEILYQTPQSYFERIKEIRMEYHNLDQNDRHLKKLGKFLTDKGFHITHLQTTSETNGSLWAKRQ